MILDSYQQIEKGSNEFERCGYLLELKLGTFEVEVFKVWDVKNPELEIKFNRYIYNANDLDQACNKINSLVFKRDLGSDNDLQSVLDNGFSIPDQGGLLFPLGHVRSKLDKTQVYQAIISEVAIGRALKLTPDEITDTVLLDEDIK
jgi:hypothetical protein